MYVPFFLWVEHSLDFLWRRFSPYDCLPAQCVCSDFGITQVVDGNWGVHAIIPKGIFEGVERNPACDSVDGGVEEDSGSAALSLLIAIASAMFVLGLMV